MPVSNTHTHTPVVIAAGHNTLSDFVVFSGPPEPPSDVHLSVSSSTSLRVYFQEPLCHNSAVITKYRGE